MRTQSPTRRSRSSQAFSLLEHLEPRLLLDGTITFDSGTGILTITGTPERDDIFVRRPKGGANGEVEVIGAADESGNNLFDGVKCVVILGGNGDDKLQIAQPKNAAKRPTDPDGNPLKASIDGGAGDDTIEGGAGDDTLIGGDGNDKIRGNDGNDTIDGGMGNDDLDGDAGNDTINGADGADKIKDTKGNNSIMGGAGFDLVTTGSGNDTVDLGADSGFHKDKQGDNEVDTGTGEKATLRLGNGNNVVVSNTDTTDLKGKNGNLTYTGSDGVDMIRVGRGAHEINTFGGNDWFRGRFNGPTDLDLGPGNDWGMLTGVPGGQNNFISVIDIDLGTGDDWFKFNVHPRSRSGISGIVIFAGPGMDTVHANFARKFNPPFTSEVHGGDDDDLLFVTSARNTVVTGGIGNDMTKFCLKAKDKFVGSINIRYNGGSDGKSDAGSDNDEYRGKYKYKRGVMPNIQLDGDHGNDTFINILRGSNPLDATLNANLGPGNDMFWGTRMNETVDGGDGFDEGRTGGGPGDNYFNFEILNGQSVP